MAGRSEATSAASFTELTADAASGDEAAWRELCGRLRNVVWKTVRSFGVYGADALQSLGYGGVEDVRQGKYFELDLKTNESSQARALAAEVADKLLANPVIESYRVEVD